MVIGTLIGLMSGFFEGWPARILYRFTEWFLVLPFLLLALVMAAVLGRSLLNIILVIGVTELAEHRPADPQPDPVGQGAPLPRARSRARAPGAGTR